MKTLFAILAAGVLTAGCAATAADEHDHSAQAGAAPMHGHMKLMKEQMARIRAEQDPKEKERLMNEHMNAMEQGMARMQGMGCAKM